VMPWDDSLSSITDLSAYNTPITTNRVVADAEGHFQVNGQRIRFLGVNFAGDSPFMPTNNADAVAARLAKFGVNNVRFHHMDASWAYNGGVLNYNSTSSTNIRSSNLERLHYVVHRLKEHGIYANINLLVGREYRSGDGLGPEVTGMDWKDAHALGYFYGPALALQKDYAYKLLASTNRFTGMTLAQDPAVAFVEIINENGFLQKWYEGALDRLPARYGTNLQGQWNAWLARRYTNSEPAMFAAWKAADQPLGPNLLRNGDFSSALTYWNTEQHQLAKATFIRTNEFVDGKPCARVQVTTPGEAGWHVQFNQPYLALSATQAYTLTFWAKSSTPAMIEANAMQAHADWVNLGYRRDLALTTNWQGFTNTFQPNASDSNARVGFSGMGTIPAMFYFADVRLQAGGRLGLPPDGTSLAQRNLPNIAYSGNGFTGTREARRDWVRFLRELETAYYEEMVAFVRTNCGYPGLIFGTILANSPATVQSRLDVIDSHAYWHHPEFPGQPWDPVNWTVQNASMVDTLANTLPTLGRQRIKGKPFTVTEYNHPAPIYYGGEGSLMLAAYGGLQDWDGLWLFDYGHGGPAPGVNMGYVRGFFNVGQHPTAMANLPLAANLFRRGDVRSALHERTVSLSSERELDLLLGATQWNVFSSGQLGMPPGTVFSNRISTVLTDAPMPPPAAITGSNIVSDTGELRWDASAAGSGLLTYNTRKSKGLIGRADNKTVTLDNIAFRPGATKLGWCTLGMTLLRGEVMTNDCTALIVASGWWENTGQVWKDASKTSVGSNWGTAPVLAEVVPFEVTLPVGTNHVRAWVLDERGRRKTALPVLGNAASTTIMVDTNAASLWFEVEVARWMTRFDQWRWRNFDGSQLADETVSGSAATAGPDAIPNLLRYLVGVDASQAAPRDRLPREMLTTAGSDTYLAMTLAKDKLVADVQVTAEVSPDLRSWFSGPGYTIAEPESDLGEHTRLTFRSAQPVAALPWRFMRLRFDLD